MDNDSSTYQNIKKGTSMEEITNPLLHSVMSGAGKRGKCDE